MPDIALTGNEALALALKQINPEVVAAYPITPQTEIVQLFSQFVADGAVDTEFITVESEHSAMSATIGAAAGGVRAMTATAANGLALMWEVIYIAASSRLPIVMPVINRALSAPINIHCDHSDAMGARDSGWVQLFGENAQQAYDNLIQAVKIAEDKNVRLPVMVNMDGFIISHAVEGISILGEEKVRKFIGSYRPQETLLDREYPTTFGPLALQDYYFEHKRQQVEGMKQALKAVKKVGQNFFELTGREYGYFEKYRMDDARIALIGLGSTMGTAHVAVDKLRQKDQKVGLINLRLFRPFPGEEIKRTLEKVEVLGVLDRADTFSLNGGPLFADIRNVLYPTDKNTKNNGQPKVVNYIYGLGGRDINVSDLENIYRELIKMRNKKEIKEVKYYGVRE
ncbi:MAG: pyruvate ferredoxin oxidoreductase [Halanaerobiales bacterium]